MSATQRGFIDRYEAAGLRKNPFTAPQQPASSGFDCDRLFVDRGVPNPPAPGSKTLVQIIGESGMGKSTHLQAWRRSVPGPFHYIPRSPYAARWATPPTAGQGFGTIYGDEIDRMPRLLRARWFRSLAQADATLVVGTHLNLSALALRCGFRVITHHLAPVDHATLRKMVDARMAAFATGITPRVAIDDSEIQVALDESNGVPGLADVALHRLVAHRVM